MFQLCWSTSLTLSGISYENSVTRLFFSHFDQKKFLLLKSLSKDYKCNQESNLRDLCASVGCDLFFMLNCVQQNCSIPKIQSLHFMFYADLFSEYKKACFDWFELSKGVCYIIICLMYALCTYSMLRMPQISDFFCLPLNSYTFY